jgi:hypothetical protein
VAGDITESGSAGARPLRIRPHWWAVLAVSLALLALVAAATSDHPTTSGHGRSALSVQRHRGAPPASSPTTTSTSTTLPQTTTTTVTPSTSQAAPATDTARGNDVSSRTSTAPVSTTTTTTVTTTASTDLGAAPTQPAGPVATRLTTSGLLQQPDVAYAHYTFTGVGSMTVSVTWTYATPLSLTVSCPDGSDTKVGTSSLSVMIPNAGGDCGMTLQETLVQYDAVDYDLTIGPTNGG